MVAVKWSEWQIGKRYDFRVSLGDADDVMPSSRFVVRVQIRDQKVGGLYERKGRGTARGNECPTTVFFGGRHVLLHDLLLLEDCGRPADPDWSPWEPGKRYSIRASRADLTRIVAKTFTVRIHIRDRDGFVYPRIGSGKYVDYRHLPTKVRFRNRVMYYNQILELS